MSRLKGFFRTFLRRKKSARVSPHSGSELGADFTSSTPSAQLEGFFIDEDGGVWMRLLSGRETLLCSDEQVCWDEPGFGSYWVHGERHGVRLSGLPSYFEASRAAACGG